MLNILVCVKQVPDINLVKMDPVTGSLIRAGVPAILNPLDANALEAAVRVKEAHGGTVTVITMGPDMAKEALRAKYPCLLTVEKANFRPRIPNLKRWKASRTAPIAVYSAATIPGLDPAQIGDPGSPTKVPRTYPPEVGAKGSMIDEGSTEKNVDRLFERIADVL